MSLPEKPSPTSHPNQMILDVVRSSDDQAHQAQITPRKNIETWRANAPRAQRAMRWITSRRDIGHDAGDHFCRRHLWYTCVLSLFIFPFFKLWIILSKCGINQKHEEERLTVLLETHFPKFQRRHFFPTMLTCIFFLQNSTENYKTHKGPKGSWFIQCFYGFRRLLKSSRFVCFFSMPRFRWSLVARRSAAALPQKTSLATAATCRKTHIYLPT